MRISGSICPAASRSMASSARRRARLSVPPTPATGLMTIATRGRATSGLAAEHARGRKPAQLAQASRRQAVHVNPAHGALAELERSLQADELGREMAQVRLVTYKRDARAFRQPRDLCHHCGMSTA